MTLSQQKNIFLDTTKAQEAVNYARKWFDDFNSTKLEPAYLSYFYQNELEQIGGRASEADLMSYENLFWYWFRARYVRLMTEKRIAEANREYEALMSELDSNPFTTLGNVLAALVTYAPYFLIGGFALWGYSKIKR